MDLSNPISQRLDVLCGQWKAFVEQPGARLLRWLTTPHEVPVVDAFVAKESDCDAAATPELFLRFDAPFEIPIAHGYVLREAFTAAYQEVRPDLSEAGLDACFVEPPPVVGDDDVRAFLRLLAAFLEHQASQVARLVVFLAPSKVRDPGAYQQWLHRLLLQVPDSIRLVVVDSLAQPELAELAQIEPDRVQSTLCDLAMDRAASEVLAGSPTEAPGERLRALFVRLSEAAEEGDLALALPLADAATQLAESLGWPHLAALAQSLLAALHRGMHKPTAALECYARVDCYGRQTAALSGGLDADIDGDLAGEVAALYGLRLSRDARFGQGAVLACEQAFDQAGGAFLEAARLSRKLADAHGELDALRLACTCFSREGRLDAAWAGAMQGLEVARAMDDETRRASCLGELGIELMRLTQTALYDPYRGSVLHQLEQLLGPDWADGVERGLP